MLRSLQCWASADNVVVKSFCDSIQRRVRHRPNSWTASHLACQIISAMQHRTMRIAILSSFLAVCLFTTSAFADSLYKGGWRVSDGKTYYTLVSPELKTPKTFALYCVEIVDDEFARFSIVVDGNQLVAPIGEAGGAFINGKSVSLRKSSKGEPHHCTWEILELRNIVQEKTQWFGNPKMGPILLGHFSEATRFRIDFNLKSIGCENGELRVMVDGKQIQNFQKKVQVLLEGSSFVGKGKIISIVLSSGTCEQNNFFWGQLCY